MAVLLKPATRELREIQAGLLVSMRNGHACAPFPVREFEYEFRGNERLAPSFVPSKPPVKTTSTTGLSTRAEPIGISADVLETAVLRFASWRRCRLHDVQFDQSTLEIARRRIEEEEAKVRSILNHDLKQQGESYCLLLRNDDEERSSRSFYRLVQRAFVRQLADRVVCCRNYTATIVCSIVSRK